MEYELDLDIEKGDNRFSTMDDPIELRQTDAFAYSLLVNLKQAGCAIDLTGRIVRFYAKKPDGTKVIDGQNVEVVSETEGVIRYAIPPALTANVGSIPISYFRITNPQSDGWSATTGNIAWNVIGSVDFTAQELEDYIPDLDDAIKRIQAQETQFAASEQARREAWSELAGEVSTKILEATEIVGNLKTESDTKIAEINEEIEKGKEANATLSETIQDANDVIERANAATAAATSASGDALRSANLAGAAAEAANEAGHGASIAAEAASDAAASAIAAKKEMAEGYADITKWYEDSQESVAQSVITCGDASAAALNAEQQALQAAERAEAAASREFANKAIAVATIRQLMKE